MRGYPLRREFQPGRAPVRPAAPAREGDGSGREGGDDGPGAAAGRSGGCRTASRQRITGYGWIAGDRRSGPRRAGRAARPGGVRGGRGPLPGAGAAQPVVPPGVPHLPGRVGLAAGRAAVAEPGRAAGCPAADHPAGPARPRRLQARRRRGRQVSRRRRRYGQPGAIRTAQRDRLVAGTRLDRSRPDQRTAGAAGPGGHRAAAHRRAAGRSLRGPGQPPRAGSLASAQRHRHRGARRPRARRR